MSPTLAAILKPTVLMARIIWLALTAAIPFYVVVAWIMLRDAVATGVDPVLSVVCGVMAFVTGAAAIVLPRFVPPGDLLRRVMASDPDVEMLARDPQSGATRPEMRDALAQLEPRERRLLLLRPLFTTQSIVRAALSETIALLGFVLAFTSGTFAPILPFAAAAIVVQVLVIPRFEPLAERALEYSGP